MQRRFRNSGRRDAALNTVAVSRGDMGDRRGFSDLEEVIELSTRLNLVAELLRAWNNQTALHILHGSLEKTREGEHETIRLARHYGQHGTVRFIEGGAAAGNRYHAGEWDDASARVEKIIANIEQEGTTFYQAAAMYAFRGLFRLARGDDAGAESDAEEAVVRARPIGDAQAVNPDLALAAFIFASVAGSRSTLIPICFRKPTIFWSLRSRRPDSIAASGSPSGSCCR